ncbi:MmgE/PrpD family protein [Nostocoides sp. HKS02]|uniref:MmgE/PrpD family protein n=1 Tax=Nostocoides sp. HKS02 TaxID=1813880 RepID=UPI0012B4694F|nr:MmgE/PrpD family protein [Tetrasphaera sp. HKS02]QGN58863.1 MmgE/PrpD family protein [Tetrasphaera sp. HKS02]
MTTPTISVPPVTQLFADFALSRLDLPESARRAARMTLANGVGVMVGGSRDEAVSRAVAAMTAAGEPTSCAVWGRTERTSMTAAALVGGIAAHVQDFDDTDLRTVIHAAAPIVPAALAVAEAEQASLAEVIDAVAVGVEITLRVGLGLGMTHFARGWHITGTTGRIGAAAAAGRLLGLTPDQMVNALGIAATEAAGLQAAFGTMAKSFHAGKAAYDGVEAALLASFGFTAARDAIEGRRGLAAVMADDAEPAIMVDGLGSTWEIEHNAFKPYACGIVSHPVIDAGVELRDAGVTSQDVDSVRLRTNPVVLQVMGVADPTDGLQSKFSVYHCFAVGLLDGAGGPVQFSDERAVAPEVVALRRLVMIEPDPAVARDECYAHVSGRTSREVHIEHATGSEARPFTEGQLVNKFVQIGEPVLGADRARELVDALIHGDDRPVADLINLAAVTEG